MPNLKFGYFNTITTLVVIKPRNAFSKRNTEENNVWPYRSFLEEKELLDTYIV